MFHNRSMHVFKLIANRILNTTFDDQWNRWPPKFSMFPGSSQHFCIFTCICKFEVTYCSILRYHSFFSSFQTEISLSIQAWLKFFCLDKRGKQFRSNVTPCLPCQLSGRVRCDATISVSAWFWCHVTIIPTSRDFSATWLQCTPVARVSAIILNVHVIMTLQSRV